MTFREFYKARHGEGETDRMWYGLALDPYDTVIDRLANALADYADEMTKGSRNDGRD